MNAETSATNADFKKVWASMQAFRNDEYLWWQVAEYTYDTFMIRTRHAADGAGSFAVPAPRPADRDGSLALSGRHATALEFGRAVHRILGRCSEVS